MVTGLATCTGPFAYMSGIYTAELLTQSFLSAFNACGLTSALTPLSLNTCLGAATKIGEMSSSCGEKAQTGEETCENKGLGPSECTAVGCCQYDNAGGTCRSAVGSAPCSSGSGGGSGSGGDGPPRTPATCASDACV